MLKLFWCEVMKAAYCIWQSGMKKVNLTMQLTKRQIALIQDLCKNSQVKSLFAFGSVTRNDFNASSDVDLVVDFEEKDPFRYTDLYFNLKEEIEGILQREVDLLEERAIRNRLFKQHLDESKVKIYGN